MKEIHDRWQTDDAKKQFAEGLMLGGNLIDVLVETGLDWTNITYQFPVGTPNKTMLFWPKHLSKNRLILHSLNRLI